MGNNEVRLRYSGFILFLSRLISIGTGIVFSLMITRSVSGDEYGIWGNITDILSYATLLSGVFPFWTMRFVARKHPGSSVTGLIANILIGIPCSLIYISLLPFILPILEIETKHMTLYMILTLEIFEYYVLVAFESILQSKKPQAVGYGFLIFEVCKIILGSFLIVHLKLGLLGVLFSVIIANLFQLTYYFGLTLNELRERIKWEYIREWMKASPFNLYSMVGKKIATLNLILLFVYGGELSRAYYGAAMAIAGTIGYSSLLGYALYPRLLSRDSSSDIKTSLKMVFMFAIPMTFGVLVLARSFLTILNEIYSVAETILMLLAVDGMFNSFSSLFNTIVYGTEKLDSNANITFKKLARSKLIIPTSLPYIKAVIVLPLSYLVLNQVSNQPLEATMYVYSIILVVDGLMMVARYYLAKKSTKFSMPWKQVMKYTVASTAMVIVISVLPHPTSLSMTLVTTLIGISVYTIVISAIDSESRLILKDVINKLLIMVGFSDSEKNGKSWMFQASK